jgi:hypothetical protein
MTEQEATQTPAETMMGIKLVSDGTTEGTCIINAATGQRIGMIRRIEMAVDAETQGVEVVLRLHRIPVEFSGEARMIFE